MKVFPDIYLVFLAYFPIEIFFAIDMRKLGLIAYSDKNGRVMAEDNSTFMYPIVHAR